MGKNILDNLEISANVDGTLNVKKVPIIGVGDKNKNRIFSIDLLNKAIKNQTDSFDIIPGLTGVSLFKENNLKNTPIGYFKNLRAESGILYGDLRNINKNILYLDDFALNEILFDDKRNKISTITFSGSDLEDLPTTQFDDDKNVNFEDLVIHKRALKKLKESPDLTYEEAVFSLKK